jgi:hypothetical protein
MNISEAKADTASTRAADRMRRSRERRRRGIRFARIQLHVRHIEALIRKGYLGPAPYDQGDIEFALNNFVDDALTDGK